MYIRKIYYKFEIDLLLENIDKPNMDNRLGELDAIDIDHFGPEYYLFLESNMEDEFDSYVKYS